MVAVRKHLRPWRDFGNLRITNPSHEWLGYFRQSAVLVALLPAIRNSKYRNGQGLEFFRFSFWDGRLGAIARACRRAWFMTCRVPNRRSDKCRVGSSAGCRRARQNGMGGTEIRRAAFLPHSLPRRSNSPRRNAVKTERNGDSALELSFPVFILGWTIGGARASRVRVRASRPNHWLNNLVWETGFRRDAENGNRDGRAPHFRISALLAASSNLPRRNDLFRPEAVRRRRK